MTIVDGFRTRLADGEVVIIDGGMGSELTRRGVEMHKTAWAAPAVLTDYDKVRETHEDYIRAGADVLIANTFMANYDALKTAGLEDRTAEINRLSVQAAVEARENVADRPVMIAGALFGGYAGDYQEAALPDPSVDEQRKQTQIRQQAEAMAEGGAELMALEMIQKTVWGRAATNAVTEVGLPIWLGVSYGRMPVDDGPDFLFPFDPPGAPGEQVTQILESANPAADVMAVTLMHTELEDVGPTLDEIEPHWSGPLGVYPHHGTHSNEAPGFHALPVDPDEFAALGQEWVARGVQIIGGCCGIHTEHIRALKDALPERIPQGVR